jgi:hypothetical protein
MRTPKEKIADYDFGRHLYIKRRRNSFLSKPKKQSTISRQEPENSSLPLLFSLPQFDLIAIECGD